MTRPLRELQRLGEVLLVIVVTWVALGWVFDRPFAASDGTVFVAPFTRSALAAGFDWTHHLYRFGVLGGSVMHDFNGTLPLVQLCAGLGLSTTLTMNIVAIFIQLCFGWFGLVAVEALVTRWKGAATRLTVPQRIVCVWLTAFAPVLAWRLAFGHEILLLGLLPLYAGLALYWQGQPTPIGLGLATFAVWNAVSCLGQQTLIYSIVFGAPLAIAAVASAPRGTRWGRSRWAVVAALVAGVLIALPRLAGMLAHALGDDASRTMDAALVYAYPSPAWSDWLGSLAWTDLAGGPGAHERNFPIGPLVAFAILAWPRGTSRAIGWALLGSAVVAIGFAAELPPFSALAHVPVLAAFRVPARALLPLLVFLPVIALGCWWTAAPDVPRRQGWLAIGAALACIAVGRHAPAALREAIAVLGCVGLAALARWRPAVLARPGVAAGFAVIAALAVVAFGERFPRLPADPIEQGPAELRDTVLARAPELAMPLDRIEIADPPPPYDMSLAFAAGLPSLDGDMIPPRRFFALVGALTGKPVPPTAVVWKLTRSRAFPVLQQLYNVRYVLRLGAGALDAQPPTPGPAWFVANVETADPATIAQTWLGARDLRETLRATAWTTVADPTPAAPAPACQQAVVGDVTTDDLGQAAQIAVTTPADCVLVVATTYATILRAAGVVDGASRPLAVFPVDIALIGIAVPAGTSRVVVAPEPLLPMWASLAQLAGIALLGAAIFVMLRRSARPRV